MSGAVLRNLMLICLGPLLCMRAQAADLQAFISKQCMECHDHATRKAGLSFESLNAEITSANAQDWLKALQQLERRTMPPADPQHIQADHAAIGCRSAHGDA